jgi:hypothetical protein
MKRVAFRLVPLPLVMVLDPLHFVAFYLLQVFIPSWRIAEIGFFIFRLLFSGRFICSDSVRRA